MQVVKMVQISNTQVKMMIRACFAFSCLLAPVLAWSQQANVNLDYNPHKNTENLIPFSATLNSPDVRDDGTVAFRLKAPAAKQVRLSGVAVLTTLGKSGRLVPFTKGGDGVWTLTAGPLKPDMCIYYFDVDGVRIADPKNSIAGFTGMPPYSQLVERDYSVRREPKSRALSGQSMGARHTMFVGFNSLDLFASFGVLSAGLFGGIGTRGTGRAAAGTFNAEEQVPGLLTNVKSFNDSLEVFYVSVGEQDPRLELTKKAVADFKSHGLNVEFAFFPGGHEWQVRRKSLHDFAQRIFKL